MPWTPTSFASRHNHSLHGEKAGHAARIANATLRSGVPEGEAIAIANKWAQRHASGGAMKDAQSYYEPDKTWGQRIPTRDPGDDRMEVRPPQIHSPIALDDPYPAEAHGIALRRDEGGGIDPTGDIGGITPTAQNMNPMAQQMIQRYATMSPEQLAEMGTRLMGTPQGALVQRLLAQKRMMSAQQQPTTGYRRGGVLKRDMGGMMSASEASPWWTRREASGGDSGFLHGTTGGRTDAVKTQAPGGSYVIPADVISGLGEGNSLAGARVASAIFGTGPFGTPLPRGGGGRGPPHPPSVPRNEAELKTGGPVPVFKERARGGGDSVKQGNTPVDLSHGEFVLGPEDIKKRFGVEDPKHAYPVLDKWVVAQRDKHIAKLKKLPGPVKAR